MAKKIKSAGMRLSMRAKFRGSDRVEVVVMNETNGEIIEFSLPLDWGDTKHDSRGKQRKSSDVMESNEDPLNPLDVMEDVNDDQN